MRGETVLVTGGAGYIGSHACVALLDAGYEVVVLDNLCNSKRGAIERVEQISGRPLAFHQVDLLDTDGIDAVFGRHQPQSVIHFAGLKAVGESTEQPLRYWQNNVGGSAKLFDAMRRHNVRQLVFSSSCTVYGAPETLPGVVDGLKERLEQQKADARRQILALGGLDGAPV